MRSVDGKGELSRIAGHVSCQPRPRRGTRASPRDERARIRRNIKSRRWAVSGSRAARRSMTSKYHT